MTDGSGEGEPRNWKKRWDHLDPNDTTAAGGGGQGEIFRVKGRPDTEFAGVEAVIKVLKSQRDQDRRRRMHREVEALRTLSHLDCVPKLFDGNTILFDDEDAKLFFAMERIDGVTIEALVQDRGPLALEDAVSVTQSILERLGRCHAAGIGHRDIKPDNLMLRHSDLVDVIFLDFGLTFNAVEEEHTGSEQHMGNRFLRLPELNVGSQKRDTRSDVAMVAGVLFFLLTGRRPVELRDHEERMPHQRIDAGDAIRSLPEPRRRNLERWFNKAFERRLDNRWQDARTAAESLARIDVAPSASGEQERLSAIRGALGMPSDDRDRRFEHAFSIFDRIGRRVAARLALELPDIKRHGVSSVRTRSNKDYQLGVFSVRYGFTKTGGGADGDVNSAPWIRFRVSDDEWVAEEKLGDDSYSELDRGSLSDLNLSPLEEKWRALLIERLGAALVG